jgi:CRP/FNR family transcriptional regulator
VSLKHLTDKKEFDFRILKTIPIFSELPDSRLEALFEKLKRNELKRNTCIFLEGEPGKEFFIVAKGKVKIFLSSPEGREVTLTFLEPPQFFGELSLLDDLPRSASARTVGSSILYSLRKESFQNFLTEYPQAALRILKTTTEMVRRLTEQVHSLVFKDVQGRVAKKILDLSKKQIGIKFTHQELANMIGSARETVSRVILNLEEKRVLKINRDGIQILQIHELEKLL